MITRETTTGAGTTSAPEPPQPMPPSGKAEPELVIDWWADLTCPWCYLGKSRLDRAVAALPERGVAVVVRSFELDPGMSKAPTSVTEMLTRKFGGTPATVRRLEERVAALAEADGLAYSLDRPVANSFDVHRVLHLARSHGVGTPFFSRLQHGYFAGRLDPFEPGALIEVASGLGVPPGEVRTVLAGDDYAAPVREEIAEGIGLGITGVPFAVLGNRYGVPGAQSVEAYSMAIARALAAGG
ncbi:MAG: DsbA family oxidoreductase [Candidatus Dormiibacterota bacterium]